MPKEILFIKFINLLSYILNFNKYSVCALYN